MKKLSQNSHKFVKTQGIACTAAIHSAASFAGNSLSILTEHPGFAQQIAGLLRRPALQTASTPDNIPYRPYTRLTGFFAFRHRGLPLLSMASSEAPSTGTVSAR